MGINSLLPRSISLRKKAGQAKEGKASDNGDSLPDAASSKPVQPYPVQPPPAAANADEPKKTAESPASSPDAKKPKESIAEKAIHKVDDKVHDVVNRVVPSSMVKAAGSAGSKANHAVDKVTHSKTSQKADKAGFAMVNMVGAAAKKGLNAAQHTGHEALKKVAGAAHDAQSMVGVAAVVSDADIGKPTPPHRWFQPAEGWPDVEWHSEWWQDVHSPPLLMPTAKEVPSLFATRIAPIGELRVEILEAEGLKAPSVAELVFDKIDPYAVFLFEGCAARTNVRRNTYHPRWHHMSARAFAFPIRFPYSCLYMALMDKDCACHEPLPPAPTQLPPRAVRALRIVCLSALVQEDILCLTCSRAAASRPTHSQRRRRLGPHRHRAGFARPGHRVRRVVLTAEPLELDPRIVRPRAPALLRQLLLGAQAAAAIRDAVLAARVCHPVC